MVPPKKTSINSPDNEDSGEAEKGYYLSVRNLPFDLLRQRINAADVSASEKRAARRELLLKMGAKPPKGKAINYRALMETRKQEKQAALSDYKAERFKKITLQRHLGKHVKNKRKQRGALRHAKGKGTGKSSGITHIPKSMVKRFRRRN